MAAPISSRRKFVLDLLLGLLLVSAVRVPACGVPCTLRTRALQPEPAAAASRCTADERRVEHGPCFCD